MDRFRRYDARRDMQPGLAGVWAFLLTADGGDRIQTPGGEDIWGIKAY